MMKTFRPSLGEMPGYDTYPRYGIGVFITVFLSSEQTNTG